MPYTSLNHTAPDSKANCTGDSTPCAHPESTPSPNPQHDTHSNPQSPSKGSKRDLLITALAEAFPHTLPIFVGYGLMGMVFGVLLYKAGFGALWALGMSVCIYAGATQFACVALLASGASLIETLIISLTINARQIFYAISCLPLFSPYVRKKWYLAFTLTDETFALIHIKAKGATSDKGYFMCAIAFLHHSYWILGCVSGALLGRYITFNTQGLGFVMSAIFIVLFIDQCKNSKQLGVPFIGVFVSFACLIIFGKDYFLLPSLLAICAVVFYTNARKSPQSPQENPVQ